MGNYLLGSPDGGQGTVAATRAAALFGQSCALGDGQGCLQLSRIFSEGRGVPASLEKSARLEASACELGSFDGCNAAVNRTPRAKLEPGRIEASFSRKCDGGETSACFGLGHLYLAGNLLAEDRRRGRELLEKACKAHDVSACTELR